MRKKNRIVVTIPFNKINVNEFHIDNNHIKKTEDIIIRLIWNNPNISIPQLMIKTKLSESGVKYNLRNLRKKKKYKKLALIKMVTGM